jgi:glucan 1,3-beta-glucosidase
MAETVTAIELLNEPLGSSLDLDGVRRFYELGYAAVGGGRAVAVTIHDAFQDCVDGWNGFMGAQSAYSSVMLDHHDYQVFSDAELNRTLAQHVATACDVGRRVGQTDKWLVVAEWSAAMTDCAQWLNGLGRGARYDGSLPGPGAERHGDCARKYQGTVAGLSADEKTATRRYVEAQLDAFERHTGWIFWAWKAEQAPEWNFRDLLAAGLVPQPLSSRQYPGQCGY